jgi:hypothetical protein
VVVANEDNKLHNSKVFVISCSSMCVRSDTGRRYHLYSNLYNIHDIQYS